MVLLFSRTIFSLLVDLERRKTVGLSTIIKKKDALSARYFMPVFRRGSIFRSNELSISKAPEESIQFSHDLIFAYPYLYFLHIVHKFQTYRHRIVRALIV